LILSLLENSAFYMPTSNLAEAAELAVGKRDANVDWCGKEPATYG
jgi:hypothetical protein